MKATELRIGNYLQTKDNKLTGVTNINLSDDFKTSWFVCYGYTSSQVEPIPLTEEWLLKFGFEFNGMYWNCSNHCFELDSYKGNYINGVNGCEYIHGIEIKHVHQLQNLYHALTGNELTITK